MEPPVVDGARIVSIDGEEIGRVEGPPFEGPTGGSFFALRTPGGPRLLVPCVAVVDARGQGALRVSLPARHVGRLPAFEGGDVREDLARRALEALGTRQGSEFEVVGSLLPEERLDRTPQLGAEAGLPEDEHEARAAGRRGLPVDRETRAGGPGETRP